MKNLLFVCIILLVNSACAVTRSQIVESNLAQTSTATVSTPMNESIQTPATSINDAEYGISKLDRNEMMKTTLDRQPQEIVVVLMKDILVMYPERNTPAKVKISVVDRDLNQDGVPERIISSRPDTKEEIPSLRIFRFENKKWNCCIFFTEGSPEDEVSEIEFLSKKNGDFDLIKLTDEYVDKNTFYYQMRNDKYELIECHKIEGKAEKVVPCNN